MGTSLETLLMDQLMARRAKRYIARRESGRKLPRSLFPRERDLQIAFPVISQGEFEFRGIFAGYDLSLCLPCGCKVSEKIARGPAWSCDGPGAQQDNERERRAH